MNLSNDIYLRSAFKELDAFAIAGIGTFRKVYHAAREESFLGEFLPPSVTVEFIPKVDEKLLLEGYLIQSIHLDKQTALHMTQDIRKSILTSLATQGTYEISGIGALQRDSNGVIRFASDSIKDGFFSGDYFGFQPLKLDVMDEKHQPITEAMIQEDHNTPVASLNSGYWFGWKSTAILGIVFLFGIYLFIMDGPVRSTLRRSSLVEGLKVRNLGPEDQFLADNYEPLPNVPEEDIQDPFANQPIVSEEPTKALPTESAETDRVADPNPTSPKNQDKQVVEPRNPIASAETPSGTNGNTRRSDQAPVARETLYNPSNRGVMRGESGNTEEEVFLPQSNVSALDDENFRQRASQSGIYHVISGSFKLLRDAEKVVGEMRRRGYDAQVLTSAPTTHRVSVFRSGERKEAESFAAKLKSRGVPKSWIFHDRY